MSKSLLARWPWLVLAAAFLLGPILGVLLFRHLHRPKVQSSDMVKAVSLNNHGVGQMEKYEYAQAADTFYQAMTEAPDWIVTRINYAIAKLNMENPEHIDEALNVLEGVLRQDADNPYAHYCLGIIREYRSQLPEAIYHFEQVLKVDEKDAGAWYHLGYCLGQSEGEGARAVQCLEKACRLNPYFNAALYQLQSKLRLIDPKRADQYLDEYRDLERARAYTELKTAYSCMGSKYAEVIGRPAAIPVNTAPMPAFSPAEKFQVRLAPGARWATNADFGGGPIGDLRRLVRTHYGGVIVRLDYNHDEKLDLFLTGAVVENAQVRDLLLKNEGNGIFADVTREAGLGGFRPSLGACACDFDNDGRTDLLITGAGTQKLFRNTGDKFEDVTAQADLDSTKTVCLTAAAVDLEQDGDLDFILAECGDTPEQALQGLTSGTGSPGGIRVFLNVGKAIPVNPDESDARLTTKFQRHQALEDLAKGIGAVSGLAVTDVDGDRDLDLMLLPVHGAPRLILNDRLLRFHVDDSAPMSDEQKYVGALVFDFSRDESSDFLLLSREKTVVLRNTFPKYESAATNAPPLRQAQAADVDLDGWIDLVGLSRSGKPVLLTNDREGKQALRPEAFGLDSDWPKDLIAAAVADLDDDGNPDLLTWSESTGLALRRSLGNGNQCLKIRLSGRRHEKHMQPMRVNQDAHGAKITAQSGAIWTSVECTTLSAGLGQSSAPLELGLGPAAKAEVVRMRWPDLVVSAEVDIPTGGVRRILQAGRKPSSCPVIFAWDGEKFTYVTDCLGAGSVGEMLSTGGTRPPRSEESVKIDGALLKPRGGYFELKLAEPMDEAMYLDRARLVVVDHPGDVGVFPDERFAVADPPPSQRLLYFRDRIFPVSAQTSNGNEVAAKLREWDRNVIDDFRLCVWLGFAEEHFVELDFGDLLSRIGPNERVVLCLAGWTEYAYPQTIFGAIQAGVPPLSPVLEKQDEAGRWQPVAELGFPAGEPRMMTVEVTGKLAGHRGKLRIRTNMQVYWDQIFCARLLADESLRPRIVELDVADASLGFRGMCREYSPDGRRPMLYDHDRWDNAPVSSWRGWLTRYGDVTELVRQTDDRFAIGGPGDEIALRFKADGLPPLPTGWTRSFVLRTWGYCKDNAPFTAAAGDVLPLPFRAMKQYPPAADDPYPHPADMLRWHTRRIGGR